MKICGCYTKNQSESVRSEDFSESKDAPEENTYENILVNGQQFTTACDTDSYRAPIEGKLSARAPRIGIISRH
jgi:hypothetical protein